MKLLKVDVIVAINLFPLDCLEAKLKLSVFTEDYQPEKVRKSQEFEKLFFEAFNLSNPTDLRLTK